MGDQQGIGAVCLGATDGDVAPRRHDQGIDDLNGIPGLDQGFVEDHPVVAGGLHADADAGGGLAGLGQALTQLLDALASLLHGEVAEDSLRFLIQQRGAVTAFRYINSKCPHSASSLIK